MRVRLGLPADFFVYERDADFEHWDTMYPPVSRENVASRIVHQITDTDKANRLLDVLMSAATAMREYSSGCPPPAAVQPIQPTMRDNPKMLYTIQHEMSEAAWDAREKFVKTRLEYGTDEPTTAHSQMLIFTRPKPNTDARHVSFDDSDNNCLNMLHCGVQLAMGPAKTMFQRDARIISSMDMASFFTTLRLHPDIRNFWCYQSGAHNRLHTNQMVQGNSESPAIALAFLERVLGECGLKDLLMIYSGR
ncbi:hypothetical protein IW150_001598 [Coemansia sp. RSA 2607]|nr:hypothetical protein IW150_001598 [Coemansia sp. RSA 2607]